MQRVGIEVAEIIETEYDDLSFRTKASRGVNQPLYSNEALHLMTVDSQRLSVPAISTLKRSDHVKHSLWCGGEANRLESLSKLLGSILSVLIAYQI